MGVQSVPVNRYGYFHGAFGWGVGLADKLPRFLRGPRADRVGLGWRMTLRREWGWRQNRRQQPGMRNSRVDNLPSR
jgi:hypothetical protein